MFLLRWIWKNLEGKRAVYIGAILLTVLTNSMYIITPQLTRQITDTFIANEHAAENLQNHTDMLIWMLVGIVGFTLLRAGLVYVECMMFETASQSMIYKIRKVLFANIENQDARFYDRYRTGDVMTRISGDLDMVRHCVAWIIRAIIECVVLYAASVVFFFSIDWLMALCLIAMTPVILLITAAFKKKAAPKYQEQRERLSELNTAAEENISGNRVVKAFAREDYEIESFDKKSRAYRDASKSAA